MDAFFLPLLLLLLFVPLLLSYRRQRRQFNEVRQLQDSLVVGDRVMTTSGQYGTVVALDEKTLELEVAPGVVTRWVRGAIRERVKDTTPASADDADLR